MSRSRNWWRTAPLAARQAQVVSGIELGLTTRQVALACGVNYRTIQAFAAYYKMSFPNMPAKRSRIFDKIHRKRRYLSGQSERAPINLDYDTDPKEIEF